MTSQKQKRNGDAARQNLTNTMQIDKNIPIPDPFESNRKFSAFYRMVAKMEIGDSFIVPDQMLPNGSFSARCYIEKKYGFKFTQRKTAEGIRIWRTA